MPGLRRVEPPAPRPGRVARGFDAAADGARRVLRAPWRVARHDLTRGGLAGLPATVGRIGGWVLRHQAHRRWLRTIGGPATKSILLAYPRIAYRPSATHLFLGATWGQRLEMLETHYGFLNRRCSPAFFERVIGPAGFPLWSFAAGNHAFEVALQGPCRATRHREGELSLAFLMDGVALSKIAFSIASAEAFLLGAGRAAPGEPLVYVGQVQGAPDRFESIRDATALCAATTPRDLLVNALFGVADAWAIGRVVGVPSARQLSAAGSSTVFDYDAFWRRHRADLSDAGHYVIDLRNREASPPHRRAARTRKKRRFKDGVRRAVSEAMQRPRDL